MLAECVNSVSILETLNGQDVQFSYSAGDTNNNVNQLAVFVKFRLDFISFINIQHNKRLSFRQINLPNCDTFTIVTIHFPSKLHYSDSNQALLAGDYANIIKGVEQAVGHQRTLIIGDFNMNPFEQGMVQTNGFHSISSRIRVMNKRRREVDGSGHDFFYNPMWNFLGDNNANNIAGTHFYSKSVPINYFRNTFDQVLFRPDLIPKFDLNSLSVLTNDGESSLLRNGIPNKDISDHLPIKFTLNL
jgi:hypothetical protein